MANGRVTSTSGCRAVVCPSLSQRAARRVDGFAWRRATDPATFSNGCGLPQKPPLGRRLPVAVLAPVHSTAPRREVPAGRCAVLCCAGRSRSSAGSGGAGPALHGLLGLLGLALHVLGGGPALLLDRLGGILSGGPDLLHRLLGSRLQLVTDLLRGLLGRLEQRVLVLADRALGLLRQLPLLLRGR